MEKNCKFWRLFGKFDDYSILPKIRQILLHWGYEMTEKYFLLTWF